MLGRVQIILMGKGEDNYATQLREAENQNKGASPLNPAFFLLQCISGNINKPATVVLFNRFGFETVVVLYLPRGCLLFVYTI